VRDRQRRCGYTREQTTSQQRPNYLSPSRRTGLIQQISALCDRIGSKIVKVVAEVPLAPGFMVSPVDERHKLAGGFATVTMGLIDVPNGLSGSFVPPTLVQLLASGTVVVELFRDLSTASEPDTCTVALVGNFIR